MSQENVEVVEAIVDAFNGGDWDRALSYAAPDMRYDTSRDLNETRGIYTTPEGVKGAWEAFFEPWDSCRVEIDKFFEVSEDIVVTSQTGYFCGRDGIELTVHTGAVVTFRDGAVSEWVHFRELAEALEAVGLSE